MRSPFTRYFSTATTYPQSTLADIEKNCNSSLNNPLPEPNQPPKLLKIQTLIGIRSPNPSAARVFVGEATQVKLVPQRPILAAEGMLLPLPYLYLPPSPKQRHLLTNR